MSPSGDRARSWRVTLSDGRTVRVVELVATDGGALVVLDATGQPHQVFNSWTRCELIRPRHERGEGRAA